MLATDGMLTVSNGNTQNWGAEYDAFGNQLSVTLTPGFLPGPGLMEAFGGGQGYQTDSDTGLVRCGNRYYWPLFGRWLTQDPAGAGDNWYGYCGNEPVSNSDPEGLEDLTPTGSTLNPDGTTTVTFSNGWTYTYAAGVDPNEPIPVTSGNSGTTTVTWTYIPPSTSPPGGTAPGNGQRLFGIGTITSRGAKALSSAKHAWDELDEGVQKTVKRIGAVVGLGIALFQAFPAINQGYCDYNTAIAERKMIDNWHPKADDESKADQYVYDAMKRQNLGMLGDLANMADQSNQLIYGASR